MVTGEHVQGIPLQKFDSNTLCTAYECEKISRKRHPMIFDSTIKEHLQLLHIDLCGTTVIKNMSQKKYILVIVDNHTCLTWVFFLRQKSEVANEMINLIKRIEVHMKLPVISIRSDNITEFTNVF